MQADPAEAERGEERPERERDQRSWIERHETPSVQGLPEKEQEERLMRQVVDFYWSVRQRRAVPTVEPQIATAGSFAGDWTLAPSAAS